jgi:hypothetical protein
VLCCVLGGSCVIVVARKAESSLRGRLSCLSTAWSLSRGAPKMCARSQTEAKEPTFEDCLRLSRTLSNALSPSPSNSLSLVVCRSVVSLPAHNNNKPTHCLAHTHTHTHPHTHTHAVSHQQQAEEFSTRSPLAVWTRSVLSSVVSFVSFCHRSAKTTREQRLCFLGAAPHRHPRSETVERGEHSSTTHTSDQVLHAWQCGKVCWCWFVHLAVSAWLQIDWSLIAICLLWLFLLSLS